MSEYQIVMHWRLIIEDFWPNLQIIAGIDNIVSDKLIILSYTYVDKYKPIIIKAQCRANHSFSTGRLKKNNYYFPVDLLNVQREQKKELR